MSGLLNKVEKLAENKTIQAEIALDNDDEHYGFEVEVRRLIPYFFLEPQKDFLHFIRTNVG